MNMSMLMNTLVSFVTSGTQEISKPAERGMTAALIARRVFMPGSSAGNRPVLLHSTSRNQASEVATSTAVVTKVSLVCNVQRFGLSRRRAHCTRFSTTGKPSVPMNALMRIGSPTPQRFTCRPVASGVKPVLL